jgi:hypothetical protein
MRLRSTLSAAAIAAVLGPLWGAEAQSVAPTPPTEMGVENPGAPVSTTNPASVEEAVPVAVTVDEALLDAAPDVALAIEHVDMVIEGSITSVRTRETSAGKRQYNLTDIANALRSRVELHDTLLGYHRFQDGALMSVNMADGKVRSNKVVLGKLPKFEPRETADPWVGINAVAVMSGTHVSEDEQARTVLTLDKRLKPQFGLELWVAGAPVDTFGNEPRTVGPVLLLPLEAIVDALGHTLERSNGTVTVLRTQDQARISLELATGLVSVNTTPRGVTQDMQFAEADTLLLPFSAVETLTGTHIKLVPGTERVEVLLDDRLDSTTLPDGDVADEAKNTPFTAEALSYELSDRGPLRAEFTSHWGNYNLRTQVESAGGLEDFAGTQPAWASVDISSLKGWNATLGDYNSNYRELSGIGESRIRGASWRKQTESGALMAIAAGVPLSGTKSEDARVTVPVFSGFAGGARLISKDQSQDVGISASMSEDGEEGLIVIGGQKQFQFDNREKGFTSAYIAADLGAFTGSKSGADIRARGSASYSVSPQIGLSATASYDGAKFNSGTSQKSFEGVFDNRVGAVTSVSGSAYWRSAEPWSVFNRTSVGLRASASQRGGVEDKMTASMSVNVNTQIGDAGPLVSANIQQTQQTTGDVDVASTSVRLRAVQRMDWGSVTATYSNSSTDAADSETRQQFTASVQAKPWRKAFANGASVMVAPNASLNWNGEKTDIRAGASLSGDSGRAFGDRLKVTGRVSALSDFSPQAEDDLEDREIARFFGSLQARYRVSKNTELTAIYSDDFNGRNDLSIGLRGRVTFNEPRRHRLPDEGNGIMTGRVFLDRNRDGIRQEDEPGIPGVLVRVVGTRMGLNTSGDGFFTIQNVRQGLYSVTVSKRSLPLGYMVPESAQPRVTVGSGRRTSVDIPIILSGQVRGAIFVDENANGVTDPGEKRLEGQWVQLIPEDGGEPKVIQSASFGQYGFENVNPGRYKLEVTVSGMPVVQMVEISDQDPFIVKPVPVPPDIADKGGGVDLSAGILGEP